jgi:mono/diheme cytochrome c family protein
VNEFPEGLMQSRRNRTVLVVACLVFFQAYMYRAVAQQSTQDIYNKKCAVCHGKDGLGNTSKGKKVHVKDVRTNMKDSEADMIKIMNNGKGEDMDSYKNEFTPAQIKDLVAYYRSLAQK